MSCSAQEHTFVAAARGEKSVAPPSRRRLLASLDPGFVSLLGLQATSCFQTLMEEG